MSDKNTQDKTESFWNTLPGCLTGIAAVITAIAGLITVLYTVGLLQPRVSPTSVPPIIAPVVSTPSPPPTQAPVVSTTVPPPTCIPILISPEPQAILDNGRQDTLDPIVWDFDWSDCLGASEYHLYVKSVQAQNPILDITLTESAYHYVQAGSYIADQNRFNRTWQVRAKVNGQWGEWSEIRVFEVEPLNTDDPATP